MADAHSPALWLRYLASLLLRDSCPIWCATRSSLIVALVLSGLAPIAHAEMLPIRILMVGDSITNGRVSGPDGPGYTDLVVEWLGEGTDYEITVHGCGGSMTKHWLPGSQLNSGACGAALYENKITSSLPADIVTILLGTNDTINLPADPPPEIVYGDNLEDIVSELLFDGVDRVVLMTPPVLPVTFGPNAAITIAEFRSQVQEICLAFEKVLCGPDLWSLLDAELHFDEVSGNYQGKDIHPNILGHEVIATNLFETLTTIPEPTGLALQCGALVTLCSLARTRSSRRSSSTP